MKLDDANRAKTLLSKALGLITYQHSTYRYFNQKLITEDQKSSQKAMVKDWRTARQCDGNFLIIEIFSKYNNE